MTTKDTKAGRRGQEGEASRKIKEVKEQDTWSRRREDEERMAKDVEVEVGREAEEARVKADHEAKQIEIEREASVVHQRIVMDGSTLVTCGAGIEVQNIICGFESCYLTIRNLPKSVEYWGVEELFTQQGVDKKLFYIIEMRNVNEGIEAKVISDAEVGQAIAAGLDGVEFGDMNILDITVADSEVPNKMDSASEANANTVTVTWKIPSVNMVAEYDTPDAASKGVERLNNSILFGRKIRAGLNRGSTNAATSVNVWDLPLTITEEELGMHSGAYLVRRLHSQPTFNTKDIEEELRKIVEGMENLEAYDVTPSDQNEFTTEARVRFRTRADAERARTSLNDRKLRSGFPRLRAVLQKPIQYVITVPLAQYRAQKDRWDSMVERGENNAAFIRITDNDIDRAFIRILGEDKKAVGQLKVRVENLVGGEVLDIALWHNWFLEPDGRRFLDDISSRTKAYI